MVSALSDGKALESVMISLYEILISTNWLKGKKTSSREVLVKAMLGFLF